MITAFTCCVVFLRVDECGTLQVIIRDLVSCSFIIVNCASVITHATKAAIDHGVLQSPVVGVCKRRE